MYTRYRGIYSTLFLTGSLLLIYTPPKRHAITFKSNNGLLRILHTPINISIPDNGDIKKFNGIWDTGASATVITQEVVDALGLQPIGMTKVNTASERGFDTYLYIIDLYLKDDLRIKSVVVTLGKLGDNFHCLIGMDVITLGDLSVTNKDGITCMSFRVPSCHEIDFVLDPHFGTSPFIGINPSKNKPCPCGSGKLYKRCHGIGK